MTITFDDINELIEADGGDDDDPTWFLVFSIMPGPLLSISFSNGQRYWSWMLSHPFMVFSCAMDDEP